MLFSAHALGEQEYAHEMWKTSAAEQGYGLMKIQLRDVYDHVTSYDYPEESAEILFKILAVMANVSEHQKIEYAPFFFFGHSAGGFFITRLLPYVHQRTAAFIAFHGCLDSEAV